MKHVEQPFDVDMLEGNYLDSAILQVLGFDVDYDGETAVGKLANGLPIAIVGDPTKSPFLRSFCREWSVGGPLVEHYGIGLLWENETWTATYKTLQAHGATPLPAAMRVLAKHWLEENDLHQFNDMTRIEALQQIYRRPRMPETLAAQDISPAIPSDPLP